jgi:hypothetical protein
MTHYVEADGGGEIKPAESASRSVATQLGERKVSLCRGRGWFPKPHRSYSASNRRITRRIFRLRVSGGELPSVANERRFYRSALLP